jgi:hypothetical protein
MGLSHTTLKPVSKHPATENGVVWRHYRHKVDTLIDRKTSFGSRHRSMV